jgi:hypothetical protein
MLLQNPEGISVLSAAQRLTTSFAHIWRHVAGNGGLSSPWQSEFEFQVFWGAVLPLALGAYGKVISRAPAQGHRDLPGTRLAIAIDSLGTHSTQ